MQEVEDIPILSPVSTIRQYTITFFQNDFEQLSPLNEHWLSPLKKQLQNTEHYLLKYFAVGFTLLFGYFNEKFFNLPTDLLLNKFLI